MTALAMAAVNLLIAGGCAITAINEAMESRLSSAGWGALLAILNIASAIHLTQGMEA